MWIYIFCEVFFIFLSLVGIISSFFSFKFKYKFNFIFREHTYEKNV